MRRKKKWKESCSVRRMFGFGMQEVSSVLYGKPALHLECGGRTEIENCKGILEYDTEKIKLDMGNMWMLLEGDDLIVDTYRKSCITVRGRIFAVRFGGEGERHR